MSKLDNPDKPTMGAEAMRRRSNIVYLLQELEFTVRNKVDPKDVLARLDKARTP